jgi:hypothetical protein
MYNNEQLEKEYIYEYIGKIAVLCINQVYKCKQRVGMLHSVINLSISHAVSNSQSNRVQRS